jgi:hypothetical protein
MTRDDDPTEVPELRDSQPNAAGPDAAAGGMGVSSERIGHTGPGQHGTDGERDTTTTSSGDQLGEDVPPEQAPGAVETNPEGIPPKAGYPRLDPRSR